MKRLTYVVLVIAGLTTASACGGAAPGAPPAQTASPRQVLEAGAKAMGGLERLQSLENFVMTGYGMTTGPIGGVSSEVHGPRLGGTTTDTTRSFDLKGKRALNEARTEALTPNAREPGINPVPAEDGRSRDIQTGATILNHPLTALLEALDPKTKLGPVSSEAGDEVVQFTTDQGQTLWLAFDPLTHLPTWVRRNTPSQNLGEVVNTTYFTGYLDVSGVQFPMGIRTDIDWRNLSIFNFDVDSVRVNAPDMAQIPTPTPPPPDNRPIVVAKVADHIWDVRSPSDRQFFRNFDPFNGGPLPDQGQSGPVVEFADHLVMFEAYGNEAETLARLEEANKIIPGKRVTHLIVSHHHFDHSGGLRAAVSQGLTIIAHRKDEALYRDMTSRPAPTFPDALARNPQTMKFMPVDEHLVLEDPTMKLDIYRVWGDHHMPHGIFAYAPRERVLLEADLFIRTWAFHFWGRGSALANAAHYKLDPLIDISVEGMVQPWSVVHEFLPRQIARARDWCTKTAAAGNHRGGCPVVSTPDE